MSIDFNQDRWQSVRTSHRHWWRGELKRPLIPVVLWDRDPGRPKPDTPLLTQATCSDLSIPADRIIDRIDYELAKCTYLGDAFPYFSMDCFGPGVIAAFLGAKLIHSNGQVWFHPPDDEREIQDLHFRFDPDNVWFRRICDLYTAGMKRWQGQVLMSMTDIGGNLDILASFRPSEKLLFDLYDNPGEVRRLTWEAHEAWHQYYRALNQVLQPVNPGYTDWGGLYSEEPGYMLQCDFCYMIGPAMFDDFVKPELAATAAKLPYAFYHLDGVGQLPHLDSLLTIPDLKGVQWVPGDGTPGCANWPEVYRKIRAAGKLIQIVEGFDALNAIGAQLGSYAGIHVRSAGGKDRDTVLRKLEAYGVV